MKVQVFTGKQKLELREKPKPQADENSVVVKVEYAGICGSDVHGYVTGTGYPIGTVMGHETSGTVAEVGTGIKGFVPGDRVVVSSESQCGECYWCKKGQYSLCDKGWERAIGLTPNHDGGFAEFVKVEYPNQHLFRLPDSISFQHGAMFDALGVSLHGVMMSSARFGDKVVVIGAGMIGLGVIQFLRLAGVGKIIALEISAKKAQLALEFGADVVLDPSSVDGEEIMKNVYELTNGIGADVVYECSGAPAGFTSALSVARKGGQVMILGISENIHLDTFTLIGKELDLKTALGYYNEFDIVADLLSRGKINADALISGVISLVDLDDKGFKRLMTNKDDIKILVRP